MKPTNPSTSLVQTHHKWGYCEPYNTHSRHSTPIILELHLDGQGTTHSRASGWKIALSHSHSHIPLLIISRCCNKDLPISLEIMDRLTPNMHLFSLRSTSAGLQVFGEICEHRLNDQQAKWMWFQYHLPFHSLHYTCSHFQIWITGIKI